jgi:hypothetical protein
MRGPAIPAPTVLPRSTVRKVERVIDAIAGSEKNFHRKVTLEESEKRYYRENVARLRDEFAKTETVEITEGGKWHDYRWNASERRLTPCGRVADALHINVVSKDGETDFWVGMLVLFELRQNDQKLRYGGEIYM